MLLQHDLPVGQPARVRGHRGRVADVAVQVGVAGGEAQRVLRRPAAGGRVEVTGAVVIKPRLEVELARGEEDRVVKERADDASRRVESRDDLAKGIIRDLVEDGTAFVQHQPHRVQVVGQQPVDLRVRPDDWRRRLVCHSREGLVTRDFHASRANFPSSQQLVPSGRGGSYPGLPA